MRHCYTSADRTSGVWMTDGDWPHIFCEWSWDPDAVALRVGRGDVGRQWEPDSTKPPCVQRAFDELPQIALGLAERLDGAPG